MMLPSVNLNEVRVALDWRIEFGLWLRSTPSQKRRVREHLTLDAYEGDVNLMAAWFEAKYGVPFAPDQLNQVNAGEYFKALEEISRPATHKRKVISARMLVQWAREAGLLDHDPLAWVSFMDEVEKLPRDLNAEERNQLEAIAEAHEVSFIGLRDSVIFFLMSDAGLRISEVVELKLSDLHLDDGYIHVLGKGKKNRDVRIGSKLIEKMRLWLDRKPVSVEGTFITDEHGLAIERGQAWRRFVLIRDAAGVRCTPHDMRHTYVMRFMDAYMKGDAMQLPAAIKAVCLQTGDKPEVILKYYTGARESNIRAAAEVL